MARQATGSLATAVTTPSAAEGGNDYLDGKGGADVLNGGGGSHDRVGYGSRTASVSVDLDGSAGDDGEAGEGDTVSADVEDVLAGSGDDQLVGNAAANLLQGGPGADSIAGGGGKDVADYSDHATTVTVDLSDPGPQGSFGEGDMLNSIEGAIGGPMGDTLLGTGADNWFRGGLGADQIAGHGWVRHSRLLRSQEARDRSRSTTRRTTA